MPDKTTLNETVRSVIDGTEWARLATPGANWRGQLSAIFSALAPPVSDPLTLTKGLNIQIATTPVIGIPGFSVGKYTSIAAADASNINPSFTDVVGDAVNLTYIHGDNNYGSVASGNASAKTTIDAVNYAVTCYGAGQKILRAERIDAYGMGDCFLESKEVSFWCGPIAGDEGQGYTTVSTNCTQATGHATATIASVARTTYSTTITQSITGALAPQTVTVASTTGANVGDWVVINQGPISNVSIIEAVQLTAVGAGTITGIFRYNYTSGDTITPALVLHLSTIGQFGQQRVLVNLSSAATYTTGTIISSSGGSLTGSGTAWSNGMVGGDANNIGVIALDKDTYSGSPFIGQPLLSWYQITAVGPTSLSLFSYSTAADTSYRGVGSFPSTYTIRPGARILRVVPGFGVICESSVHTWTAGDTVECVMCPYPDVSGTYVNVGSWTAGSTMRNMLTVGNSGARRFLAGISVGGTYNPTNTGGGDTWGCQIGLAVSAAQYGLHVFNQCDYGLIIDQAAVAGIQLGIGGGNYTSMNARAGTGGAGVGLDIGAGTFNFSATVGGTPAGLQINSTGGFVAVAAACVDIYLQNASHKGLIIRAGAGITNVNLAEFRGLAFTSGFDKNGAMFTNVAQFTPVGFASRPTGVEGMVVAFNDANNGTVGGNITAGSSSNHVLGYYNGTNWVVL